MVRLGLNHASTAIDNRGPQYERGEYNKLLVSCNSHINATAPKCTIYGKPLHDENIVLSIAMTTSGSEPMDT